MESECVVSRKDRLVVSDAVLSAYCARLLPRAAAEDVAQESLVRVWTHWRTVRDPHAYSFLVATNLVRRQ
jgi:DNA-directed RNA polymerase specialized sigma24 family protein